MNPNRPNGDVPGTAEALRLMGRTLTLLDAIGEGLAAAHVAQAIDCVKGPPPRACNDD